MKENQEVKIEVKEEIREMEIEEENHEMKIKEDNYEIKVEEEEENHEMKIEEEENMQHMKTEEDDSRMKIEGKTENIKVEDQDPDLHTLKTSNRIEPDYSNPQVSDQVFLFYREIKLYWEPTRRKKQNKVGFMFLLRFCLEERKKTCRFSLMKTRKHLIL
ncbi:X-linked retinitis pigmentosa GTPase regulator-interacting protein 1-like [Cyprinodon tularosa]|uniref:X-linked retinitis pigmentosa GTPase regulator-interacting protein 1-like n=1 Tax=Cyprinodon tularosa TaxID=77115 RepID=UPI0018E2616C|nr:X-linked retinitis pigmentosa GTPase regulator-interacting protein 1-like [Cyprinodon tularosa]